MVRKELTADARTIFSVKKGGIIFVLEVPLVPVILCFIIPRNWPENVDTLTGKQFQ